MPSGLTRSLPRVSEHPGRLVRPARPAGSRHCRLHGRSGLPPAALGGTWGIGRGEGTGPQGPMKRRASVRDEVPTRHEVLVLRPMALPPKSTRTIPHTNMQWKGGTPPPGLPACGPPAISLPQVPALPARVITSNRVHPLWQSPPTATPTAAGPPSEAPPLPLHPCLSPSATLCRVPHGSTHRNALPVAEQERRRPIWSSLSTA